MSTNLAISDPVAIRIAGEAGQGNILMGKVLSQALLKEGYWVVETEHYGAQVRGGLSYCDVLYDDDPIDYPKASVFDIIYLMHDLGLPHINNLKRNGIIFYDKAFVKRIPPTVSRITKKYIEVNASNAAYNELGNINVANMIGLGIMARVTDIVKLETLIETMKDNVNENFYEIDEKALKLGYEMINKKYKLQLDQHVRHIGRGYE